jgi:transposase
MSETPDEVIDLRPNYCNKCGSSLMSHSSKQIGRRQLIDIPPIIPITTEYRNHEIVCDCGNCQRGSYPEGLTNHIQYGKNIQSIIIYQNVYQYVPFKRLQDFFGKIMRLKISKGTLENIIRRTSKKAENTYEQLRKVIEVSFFVGSDETGAKLKGKKMWFWVCLPRNLGGQSAIVTYIVAA